ncbi:PGF-CTERM sorting domain-containing protein [Haloarcula sp. CBA1130]|uniref:PGF-CTERM sorting domain-containing protein n=1 Tax=unclassified Haloarcula TaxID=2624677 RepID=UPI0012458C0F|nr:MULTISPECIES: PGF-CTERM sorting domain-containing protein [unclassified Haloarcula]KAA9398121.1 PGF-CTERM sorting domain-containing protein [Haloarcula sp. CBA1129]KAA9402192.1 PGF-CTERM sorting domain-containing protein [Haloarcula sp. CBA1130]
MHRSVPAIGLAILVVLSGCVTATVDSTVAADGTVSEYDLTLEMSPSVYDGFQSQAQQEGYDSVEGYLLADVNTSRMANHTYEQELEGENVTLSMTFTDWNPGPESDVSTNVSEGNVTYEDRTFLTANEDTDVAFGDGVAVEYQLTMPADISSSNADIVQNETAVWEYAADEPVDEPIRATSPAPSSTFGPGMGIPVAVVALLGAALLASRD